MRTTAPRGPWALLICIVVLGSAVPATAQTHAGTIPGTLRVGTIIAPNTLNPALNTVTTESLIEQMIFDTLVYPLPDGTLEPDLAAVVPTQANGGISADGRTIVFHLRHGVRWHDGQPFTSADVAYTQRATMDPANNVTVRQPNDRVIGLDTPDPYTVVVHLARPYAPFIAEWNSNGIIPAHVLAPLPNINNAPFNGAPIGTGAFRFVRWERGNEIVLRANDDYFDGRPGLRSIILRFLSNDASAAIALRTHQIDWLFEPTISALQFLAGDPDVRVERLDAVTFQGVYFNVTRPPLSDVRIRRAIDLAIDRRAIVEGLMRGFAVPASGDIPAFMWAHDSALREPFDRARAEAMLDAAGWRRGADGIRVRDGRRLTLAYVYFTGSALFNAIAVQIQGQLRAAGIDLTLRSYEVNLVFAHDGPYAQGNFDLAFVQWYNYFDPEDSMIFSCAARAPSGFNYARWCNPEYERLKDAGVAHFDRATRRTAYVQLERVLLADMPMTFLDYPIDAEAVNADIRGFRDHDTWARPVRWSIGAP